MTTKNHGYSYRTKIVKRVIISLLLVFVLGLMNAHAQSRLTPISGAIYYGKGDLTDYEVEINSLLLPSYYRSLSTMQFCDRLSQLLRIQRLL